MIGRCSAGVRAGVARLLNVVRGPTDIRLGICRGLAGYRTNDAQKTADMKIFCLLHQLPHHPTRRRKSVHRKKQTEEKMFLIPPQHLRMWLIETQAGECILPLHHFSALGILFNDSALYKCSLNNNNKNNFTHQFDLRARKANRYNASAKRMVSQSLAHSLWPVWDAHDRAAPRQSLKSKCSPGRPLLLLPGLLWAVCVWPAPFYS